MVNHSAAGLSTGCRLCSSTHQELFISLERSPDQLSRLLKENELDSCTTSALSAYRCLQCGFVQLAVANHLVDYTDYELSWMHIRTLVQYRQKIAKDFVGRFAVDSPSILDVGCGSGEFLKCLQETGALPIGLEPSVSLVSKARAAGFTVTQGLVGEKPIEGLQSIDGWTCLQVLEHVESPVSFLVSLRKLLTRGGLGLIEVPSLEFIISERRFYDFFRDHLNYFTESTLRLALEMAGLRVLDIQPGLNRQFHVAVVAPADEFFFQGFQDDFQNLLGQIRIWANGLTSQGKRIAVWSAGYKSIAAISEAHISGIQYVIDSDVSKHGRFTPGSHLRICSPLMLKEEPVDAIILASVAYKEEILHQLRCDLSFEGEVVAMSRQLEVL